MSLTMNDKAGRVRDTVKGVLRIFNAGECLLDKRTEGRGDNKHQPRVRTQSHIFPKQVWKGGTLGADEFRR